MFIWTNYQNLMVDQHRRMRIFFWLSSVTAGGVIICITEWFHSRNFMSQVCQWMLVGIQCNYAIGCWLFQLLWIWLRPHWCTAWTVSNTMNQHDICFWCMTRAPYSLQSVGTQSAKIITYHNYLSLPSNVASTFPGNIFPASRLRSSWESIRRRPWGPGLLA